MISVIIPTYNRANYLREAIASMLSQTYQNFEIIVVDDGSTDKTREVVESFGERVRYFYQKNSGVGAARNKGIIESRGEYIAFLDADDIWFPEKLLFQMDIFEKFKADMVYACSVNAEEKRIRGEFKLDVTRCDVWTRNFKELFWWNDIPTSSVVIKKESLTKFGVFDEDRSIMSAEDYDLWLRIVSKIKIVGVREPLFYYRDHESGISKDPASVDRIKETIIRNYHRFSSFQSSIRGKLRKRLLKLYFDQGHACFNKNNFDEARRLFLEGIYISIFAKCTIFYLLTFLDINIINLVRRIKANNWAEAS